MVAACSASGKLERRTLFVWAFLLIGAFAFAGSYLLGSTGFWGSYALLVIAGAAMYAPYGPFFAIVPEVLPKNVAGEVTALVNSCGALGGFAGTWLVGLLEARTGNSRAGFLLMSVSLVLSGII